MTCLDVLSTRPCTCTRDSDCVSVLVSGVQNDAALDIVRVPFNDLLSTDHTCRVYNE